MLCPVASCCALASALRTCTASASVFGCAPRLCDSRSTRVNRHTHAKSFMHSWPTEDDAGARATLTRKSKKWRGNQPPTSRCHGQGALCPRGRDTLEEKSKGSAHTRMLQMCATDRRWGLRPSGSKCYPPRSPQWSARQGWPRMGLPSSRHTAARAAAGAEWAPQCWDSPRAPKLPYSTCALARQVVNNWPKTLNGRLAPAQQNFDSFCGLGCSLPVGGGYAPSCAQPV